MWQHTSRIRPEGHEARNEFRVDPIGLGACALARGEGLDLGGRQLPGRNPSSVKGGPQTPLPGGITPARISQQSRDPTIAVAAILPRQLDHVRDQTLLIGTAMRHFPLCGSVLPQDTAGASL